MSHHDGHDPKLTGQFREMFPEEEARMTYWDSHTCPRCHRKGHRLMDCPVEDHQLGERGITAAEFEALTPENRGYAVYMAGCRPDRPNIPDEPNPYEPGSEEATQWAHGQQLALCETMDGVE